MNTKIKALSIITLMTVANANLVAATDLTATAGDVRDQVEIQREIYRDGMMHGITRVIAMEKIVPILLSNPNKKLAREVLTDLMNIYKDNRNPFSVRKKAINTVGYILHSNPDAEVAQAVVTEFRVIYDNGNKHRELVRLGINAVGLIALKNRDIIFGPKAIFPLEALIPLVSDEKIAEDLTNLLKTVKKRTNLFAIYNAAWERGKGKVPTDTSVAAAGACAGGDSPEEHRLNALARLLHERRLCRTGEGVESVEPFCSIVRNQLILTMIAFHLEDDIFGLFHAIVMLKIS